MQISLLSLLFVTLFKEYTIKPLPFRMDKIRFKQALLFAHSGPWKPWMFYNRRDHLVFRLYLYTDFFILSFQQSTMKSHLKLLLHRFNSFSCCHWFHISALISRDLSFTNDLQMFFSFVPQCRNACTSRILVFVIRMFIIV